METIFSEKVTEFVSVQNQNVCGDLKTLGSKLKKEIKHKFSIIFLLKIQMF